MGNRSSIDALDPAIRAELDAAIGRGATLDQIVEHIQHLGGDLSRSAVGRYAKQYSDLAARQRDLASVAKGFASEFGEEGDMQERLMNQLLTSIITRVAMPFAAGDEPELDFKDVHFLARAVKDATSASKTSTDREAKVRDEATKRAKREAAEAAATSAKASGASDETIRKVRAAILGLEA